MIDALDSLIADYGGMTQFVEKFIENTLFFHPDDVAHRTSTMHDIIKTPEGKLHVRYSQGHNKDLNVKNKAEAIKVTRGELRQDPNYSDISIVIDNDGNYENRRIIKQYTNQRVSVGMNSTIKNYIISHVWGEATNPLYFSSLWNLVLIPVHFNFIMDKNHKFHKVVPEIQNAIRKICIELYTPYNSFIKEYNQADDRTDMSKIVSDYPSDRVNYVPHYDETKSRTLSEQDIEQLKNNLNACGTKFFIDNFNLVSDESSIDYTQLMAKYDYTKQSIYSRIAKMRKIFKDQLEVKALELAAKSTRLDEETKAKAGGLQDSAI